MISRKQKIKSAGEAIKALPALFILFGKKPDYFTVTLQVAVLPLNRVIFTVAVPLLTALTVALLPLPLVTVATLVLELVHFKFAAFA